MATAPASEHKKPVGSGAKNDVAKTGAAAPASASHGSGAASAGADKKDAAQRFARMAVRAKLAVTEPGDAVEREADAVADRVMRAPAGQTPAKGAAPAPQHGADQIARAAAPAAGASQKGGAPPAAPKPPEPAKGPGQAIQRKADAGSAARDRPDSGAELAGRLGAGQPLDAGTRAFFETRLGHELSDVRIHTDADAAQAAHQLAARAFTYGNHIAFAAGEFEPDTESGKRLLAHELAHVLQNRDTRIRNVVQREADPKKDKNNVSADAIDKNMARNARPGLVTLKLPQVKARHGPFYKTRTLKKELKRPANFKRDQVDPKQEEKWKNDIKLSDHYAKIGFKEGASGQSLPLYLPEKKPPITGSAGEIVEQLKTPKWAPDGTWFARGMQIDHVVELQVSGEDAPANYELLSAPHNASSGGTLGAAIRANVGQYLADVNKANTTENVAKFLIENDIVFEHVEGGSNGKSETSAEASSQFWSRADILAGKHLDWLKPDAAALKYDGTRKDRFALFSDTGSGFIDAFPLSPTRHVKAGSGRLKGIKLEPFELKKGFDKAAPGATLQMLKGRWDLPAGVKVEQETFETPLTAIANKPYGGALTTPPLPPLDVTSASPVTLTSLDFVRGKVYSNGTLVPTLEWLPKVGIPVRWRGDQFAFSHTFSATDLKLPLPGIEVDEASLTLSFGSRGLGADGTVGFRVKGFGAGMLTVGVRHSGKAPVFFAEGSLNADPRLFDEGAIKLRYATDKGFSGSGKLAINSPGKIKGIKSANVAASYKDSVFKASGHVIPDIPGLKSASLSVTYDQRLVITGQVGIDDKVPGVESADISVRVEEKADGWKVAAAGEVVPKLPGLSGAVLRFAYDEGLVLIEGEFKIRKGPLDGVVRAGVTNAPVDAAGKRSGNGGAGRTFTVFGAARIQATLIKDKLAGEIDLRVLPDGSLRVGGGLTIKDFQLFPKLPKNDQLFNKEFKSPEIPIPGMGFSVGPLHAGVTFGASGFIRANASVGPGMMRAITVTIAEFDPANIDFDTLEIGGSAVFEVPADASLTMGASIHLALSAVIARLVGTVGVEGSAGIPLEKQPVLKAQSSFTYSQAKGLDVASKIDLHLSPALKFSLKGGIAAEIDLWVTSFTVWSHDWTQDIASFNLPIGIDLSGELGYNSKTGQLRTDPHQLAKVAKPDLDKPDKMLDLLDDGGSGSEASESEEEKALREIRQKYPWMMPKSDGQPPPSSLEGGLPGQPNTQHISEADLDALGPGMPLPSATRGFFEQRMGRDLSQVRIFVGAGAHRLAKKISARAFTAGQRIVFAHGEYRPDDDTGRRLLAHELAHVGQHQDGVARKVMRLPDDAAGTAAAPAPAAAPPAGDFVIATDLQIPSIKARHGAAYQLMAGRHLLRRRAGYNSATRGTAQMSQWLSGLPAVGLNAIPAAQRPAPTTPVVLNLQKSGGAGVTTISEPDLAAMDRRLKLPTWDATGALVEYQVDHMVEFQTGGGDTIENLELLNAAHNGSVGSSFNFEIRRAVRDAIAANSQSPQLASYPGARDAQGRPTPEGVMQWKNIVFTATAVRERETRRREGGSGYWSKHQIEAMQHVLPLLGLPNPAAGTASRFHLYSPTGNMLIAGFAHAPNALAINVAGGAPASRGGIAGFLIDTIQLNQNYNTAAPNEPIGTLVGTTSFGPHVAIPPGVVSLPITQAGPNTFSGKIGTAFGAVPTSAEFTPMSRMELADLSFGRGVFGRAVLHPSHPALEGLNIPATIQNGRLGLFYNADATMLAARLRIPGLTVDAAAITFGYDGRAFSVAGGAEFTIRNFGNGQLRAMVDSEGKFQLEGGFHADPRLFDRADLSLWYRSATGFGGRGTLAITNPNKIRGIRAASVSASYDNGSFAAEGTVQPSIPGLQSTGLTVRYGPDESGADALVIGGDLALAAGIPGIGGGQVHVELAQRSDEWSVAGSGDIRPNLPGVDSNLHLEYRDGIFGGELAVNYARGIFSGNVTVGLTNRPVSPDGLAGDGPPEPTLKLYGAGSVNARLAPWLQGGVAVKVRPTGDTLIGGRIGIPGAVTVFEQYPAPDRARRNLFRMPTISVPLVGIAVGGNTIGLALTINGGIDGYAHIGPGRLTQAEIGIADFNPARPETLHVTGDARFNVPAEAGVDASLEAGLSLGAAIIRATAGINLRAGVAARADVTPAAHIDWRPDTGLHLHADLNASVSPVLRFSINGYAEVVADAFVTSFSLWRKDWNLAQREMGGSLSLGINAPVDYYSDGRGVVFDPQAVSFQVPSLSRDTLSQLTNERGSEQVRGEPHSPARG